MVYGQIFFSQLPWSHLISHKYFISYIQDSLIYMLGLCIIHTYIQYSLFQPKANKPCAEEKREIKISI